MGILKSKSGFSPAYSWVYGLFSLFGLGVLYIIFSQVLRGEVAPRIVQLTNASATIPQATKDLIFANIDRYLTYFDVVIFVLFFAVVVYLIAVSIRKESESVY